MFHQFKITSYAIIFFLFLIPFGLATTGSKAEAQARLDRGEATLESCSSTDHSQVFLDIDAQRRYALQQWLCISILNSRIEELQSQLGSAPSTTPDQSSLPSTTEAEVAEAQRAAELQSQLAEAAAAQAAEFAGQLEALKAEARARAEAEVAEARRAAEQGAAKLQSQLTEATDTITTMQAASSAAATLSTPACACADGNGLGEGAIPQDVVAPANGDMLTKQCQKDHSRCMSKIRRGTRGRVLAKKVNACNNARIGKSGKQGTCG